MKIFMIKHILKFFGLVKRSEVVDLWELVNNILIYQKMEVTSRLFLYDIREKIKELL